MCAHQDRAGFHADRAGRVKNDVMMQLEIEEEALKKEEDRLSRERLEHLQEELAGLKEEYAGEEGTVGE